MWTNQKIKRLMILLFGVALLSTIGSIYFGYFGDPVLNSKTGIWFDTANGLTACDLCRYIRIFTYPLVIIFGIGILKKDLGSLDYARPLISLGIIFSAYKYRLQMNPGVNESALCTFSQVSCSDIAVLYFGFITMPFLGIIAGTMMISGIILIKYFQSKK